MEDIVEALEAAHIAGIIPASKPITDVITRGEACGWLSEGTTKRAKVELLGALRALRGERD